MPKRLTISILVILIVVFVLVNVVIYGFAAYKYFFPQKTNNQPQAVLNLSTVALNSYTDSATGVTFQYPNSLTYASFQMPKLITTAQGNNAIDASGCLAVKNSNAKDSAVTINGMNFCLSSGSQTTSGAIIYSYNYTILKNQNYYTLEYTVATITGCSSFFGTPQYQYCLDDLKKYDSTVVPLIQKSVSSLTFPN